MNAQSAAGSRAIAENPKNGKIARLMTAILVFLLHICTANYYIRVTNQKIIY
jgi:hypothetical protein